MPLTATAITLLRAYRSAVDPHARNVHLRLLDTLVRHAPGPVYVSRAAQTEARSRGLGDLRDYTWHDQVKKMGDVGRKMFAWDHFYPVAELRRQIMALEDPTVIRVRRILRKSSVAWILKAEDRRLTALSFQHRRPDPLNAYRKAGIRLLHGP